MDNTKESMLVNANVLLDLDWALCCYCYDKFRDSEYIDLNFFNDTEKNVRRKLIERRNPNPLSLFFVEDSEDIAKELLETKMEELLDFVRPYDIFPLMVTIRERTNYDITISCPNEIIRKYINDKGSGRYFNVVIGEDDLKNYTVLYTKNVTDVLLYKNVSEMHIYIANMGINMDADLNTLSIPVLRLYADTNIFHTMDLYRDI